jgi:hypothetical protein
LPIVEPVFDLVVVLTPGMVVPALTPDPVEVKDVPPTVDVSLGPTVARFSIGLMVGKAVVPVFGGVVVEDKLVVLPPGNVVAVVFSPGRVVEVRVLAAGSVVTAVLAPGRVAAVVFSPGAVVDVMPVVLAPGTTVVLAPGVTLAPDRLLETAPGLATVADDPTVGPTPGVCPAIRLVTSAPPRTPPEPPAAPAPPTPPAPPGPSVSSDVPAIKLPPGRVVEVYPDNASDRSPGLVS